jgi:hypothetical protein
MIFSSLKPIFSRFILFILWGVGSLLLVQCGKDEDLLPALRTDLLLVRTDAQGRVMQLITDEGEILFPSQPIGGGRTDTTYRVLAVYHRHEASAQVEVRHLVQIPTAPPVQLDEKQQQDAPIQLLSLWKSKTFLNLRFGIPKSFHGQHTIGWAYRGIIQQPDGHRLLHLQLYHNAYADRNDYYEDAYLSCPLQSFSQWLTAGRDSIALEVNTYQGRYTKVFPY